MKKITFFGVFCLMLSFGSIAKPSPDYAKSLSQTMFPREHFEQMVEGIVQTGAAMVRARVESEKLKVDLDSELKKVENALRKKFAYEYFVQMNKKTMSKNFKTAELKKILDFYETNLGKKWLKHTPEIIRETMTNIDMDLSKEIPVLVEAIVPKKDDKKKVK